MKKLQTIDFFLLNRHQQFLKTCFGVIQIVLHWFQLNLLHNIQKTLIIWTKSFYPFNSSLMSYLRFLLFSFFCSWRLFFQRALQLEVAAMAEDESMLDETPLQWTPVPIVTGVSKDIGKSILIKGGFRYK